MKLAHVQRVWGEIQRRGSHSRLVDGNKQGNLHMRLAWVAARWVHLAPNNQNPKSLYRGFNRVSNVHNAGSLNNTLLSQGCIFEMVSSVETVSWSCISKTGGSKEPLIVLVLLIGHLEIRISCLIPLTNWKVLFTLM